MPINSKFLQSVFHINNSWSANWGDNSIIIGVDDKCGDDNTATLGRFNPSYPKHNWHYNPPYTTGAPIPHIQTGSPLPYVAVPHTSAPHIAHWQSQQYVCSNFAATPRRCVTMTSKVIALQVVRMLLDYNLISDVRAYAKVLSEETIDTVVVSCSVYMRENVVCNLEIHITDDNIDVNVNSTQAISVVNMLSINKSASYHEDSSVVDLSLIDNVRFAGSISDESLIRMEKIITDFITVMTKIGNDEAA